MLWSVAHFVLPEWFFYNTKKVHSDLLYSISSKNYKAFLTLNITIKFIYINISIDFM